MSELPHPRALAFLGDAIFEIRVREMAVRQGFSQSKDLHAYTTKRVNAAAQVVLLHTLKPYLTEAEHELIRQGRNVGVGAARRADQATYRQATGFECLIGALYLSDPERLNTLWTLMQPALESPPEVTSESAEEELHGIPDAAD